MSKHRNLLVAPLGEGVLILIVAAIGWAAHWPLLFASLGPTVYEILEKPYSESSKTYNIVVGHYAALGAGFFALWALDAWRSPKVMAAGFVPGPRMWAAVVATSLTALFCLALHASQPASLSTALLITLGSMQTARDAAAIAIGVAIVAAVGAPVRLQRAKYPPSDKAP